MFVRFRGSDDSGPAFGVLSNQPDRALSAVIHAPFGVRCRFSIISLTTFRCHVERIIDSFPALKRADSDVVSRCRCCVLCTLVKRTVHMRNGPVATAKTEGFNYCLSELHATLSLIFLCRPCSCSRLARLIKISWIAFMAFAFIIFLFFY